LDEIIIPDTVKPNYAGLSIISCSDRAKMVGVDIKYLLIANNHGMAVETDLHS